MYQTRSYAHDKWGFVINAEQQINDNIGVFGRLSWDNGTSETSRSVLSDGFIYRLLPCIGNIT